MASEIESLSLVIRKFAEDRDWEKFHTPKNLAMSVAIESAELMEHFQWTDGSEVLEPQEKIEVAAEIADVLIYLLRLADVLEINVKDSVLQKLILNSERFPST